MNSVSITTHNYTGEYNFSTCATAYFEHEDARVYHMTSLKDFISKVTGYLTTKLVSFSGDDDTFDNISALIEETEQIMRLAYKAAHQCEYYQALIIKACSCINETIKTVNELDDLSSIDAELQCITWLDREEKLEGQGPSVPCLEIYNDPEVLSSYTL